VHSTLPLPATGTSRPHRVRLT